MPPAPSNPFLAVQSPTALVAIPCARNGYIMLAPAQEITRYADLPAATLKAAQAWAAILEASGSPRAYWITLSEVTRHLHIHLFPRWPEDTLTGVTLFETRDTSPQPAWTPEMQKAFTQWAQQHSVTIGELAP